MHKRESIMDLHYHVREGNPAKRKPLKQYLEELNRKYPCVPAAPDTAGPWGASHEQPSPEDIAKGTENTATATEERADKYGDTKIVSHH